MASSYGSSSVLHLKPLLVALGVGLLGLVSGCSSVRHQTPASVVVETSHIKREGGFLRPDPTKITGHVWDGDDLRMDVVEETNRVPLIKNHGLGVAFWLDAEYHHLSVVTLRVTYPRMKSPSGWLKGRIERQEESYQVDGRTVVDFSYIFDADWELVPGVWTIEIWGGDRLLGRSVVTTYDPAKSGK